MLIPYTVETSIRNRYHTNIQIAEKCNILPKQVRKDISRSTLAGFRNRDYTQLVGSEFNQYIDDNVLFIKELSRYKSKTRLQKALLTLYKTTLQFQHDSPNSKKISLKVKTLVVQTITRIKQIIPVKKAVEYFNITANKFYSWAAQVKHQCVDSPLGKCLRRWPLQLTKKEQSVIKKMLTDKQYKHWPINSIAWYTIRNNILMACVSTWYKYAKLFGITRPLPGHRRKKHAIGIRANQPDQIFHADVTIFKPMDNVKVFIHILMDNFSRYILSWRAALHLSGENTVAIIEEGYSKYLHKERTDNIEKIDLIVDGGPENNCEPVEMYLDQTEVAIRKIIAQQDIIYSNSMIESVNKILKYRYLFNSDILDFEHLIRHLNFAIPDYNNDKPHGSLNGLTPAEVYFHGKKPDQHKHQYDKNMINARKNRIQANKLANCGVC